jgi:hypothetical protein
MRLDNGAVKMVALSPGIAEEKDQLAFEGFVYFGGYKINGKTVD